MMQFTVPGEVRGKGRPRAVRVGAGIRMHTDEKTASYENRVALFARQAIGDQALLIGPVQLRIDAFVQIPASWSKKKQAAALAGEIMPTGKPDADNVAKAISDALNGIAWKDDAQAVDLVFRKRYAATPCAVVTITDLTVFQNNQSDEVKR
ncbi:RusA family crossover junction endodeoxyribonuclease [Chitinilyticum litopenaei]|uniref:RusA family crossover junction endodeoxyribonuclease n=1 Tax=Chitinilyticum litopenaei TaxID=1121276 RepID=UPI0004242C83|nr:RusA family crossover junction endodeoxyribonuclease [Chitinilyticum litopenaei]